MNWESTAKLSSSGFIGYLLCGAVLVILALVFAYIYTAEEVDRLKEDVNEVKERIYLMDKDIKNITKTLNLLMPKERELGVEEPSEFKSFLESLKVLFVSKEEAGSKAIQDLTMGELTSIWEGFEKARSKNGFLPPQLRGRPETVHPSMASEN